MKNSGLTAIGHLLGYKTMKEYTLVLGQFCELSTCYLKQSLINKNVDIWKEMPSDVSLESSCNFLVEKLKASGADDFEFQLSIERLVWDQIKYRLEDNINKYNFNLISAFRLFSIFNRFCQLDKLPFEIDRQSIRFLFYKLGLVHPKFPSLTFTEFLLEVMRRRDHFVSMKIIEMYDEFTRDILIEETLLVRVYGKTDASDGRNQATEFRRVALTSNYLMIKEKETNVDQMRVLEPIRDFQMRYSLVNARFSKGRRKRSSTILTNKRSKSDRSCLMIFTENEIIELIVEPINGPEFVYRWIEALKIGLEIQFMNIDRLTMIKNKYKLSNSSKNSDDDEEEFLPVFSLSSSTRSLESSNDSVEGQITFAGLTQSHTSSRILKRDKIFKKNRQRRSRSSDAFEKLNDEIKQLSIRNQNSRMAGR